MRYIADDQAMSETLLARNSDTIPTDPSACQSTGIVDTHVGTICGTSGDEPKGRGFFLAHIAIALLIEAQSKAIRFGLLNKTMCRICSLEYVSK